MRGSKGVAHISKFLYCTPNHQNLQRFDRMGVTMFDELKGLRSVNEHLTPKPSIEMDIGELLDTTDPKEWVQIISGELDNLLCDNAQYGQVVIKLARSFIAINEYGGLGGSTLQKEFFTGITDDLIYSSNWNKLIDNVYEVVNIIGSYSNKFISIRNKPSIITAPVEVNHHEPQNLYIELMNAIDNTFVNSISQSKAEDFSQLSSDQIGDIMYRLIRLRGFDEFEIFSVLQAPLLSSTEGGDLFLTSFESMVVKYSHASTGQKGIFKIYALWEVIAKSADYFNFEVFFESTLRMYEHSAVDPYLKMRFIIELNKWLIGNQEFNDFLVQKLDLSTMSGNSTAVLLDLLHKQSRSDARQGSAVVVADILKKCEAKYPEPERNYFLQAQLTSIKNRKKYASGIATYAPLYVGDGQYVIFDPYGAAYISEKKDAQLIGDLAQRTKPRNWGSERIPSILTPDKKNSEEPDDFYDSGMFEEHEDFLTTSGEDFILVAQKYGFRMFSNEDLAEAHYSTEPISAQEVAEYLYMLQPEMRVLLCDSFGIDLTKLSRAEQFHFLNYLKHTTVHEAETMQLFIQNYGIDAMRAFLVNQYDENASENVMVFGVVIEPDTANVVFGAYAKSIDGAEKFSQNIKEKGVPNETAELARQIQESLLRRAGHLFNAGKQMALWEYAGPEQTDDLVEAFKGVAKMQDILARIGQDETLLVSRNATREGGRNLAAEIENEAFFFEIQDIITNEKLALKVFIRSQSNIDGEARINFELILNDLPENSSLKKAFAQKIEYKTSNKLRKDSVIRFGFDLDTKHNPPKFSFDMGRNTFEDATMKRTGDVLGNILNQVAVEGHHLTDFDAKFSDPEVFKTIADSFKKYFNSLT